jgi:hypothetical protein
VPDSFLKRLLDQVRASSGQKADDYSVDKTDPRVQETYQRGQRFQEAGEAAEQSAANGDYYAAGRHHGRSVEQIDQAERATREARSDAERFRTESTRPGTDPGTRRAIREKAGQSDRIANGIETQVERMRQRGSQRAHNIREQANRNDAGDEFDRGLDAGFADWGMDRATGERRLVPKPKASGKAPGYAPPSAAPWVPVALGVIAVVGALGGLLAVLDPFDGDSSEPGVFSFLGQDILAELDALLETEEVTLPPLPAVPPTPAPAPTCAPSAGGLGGAIADQVCRAAAEITNAGAGSKPAVAPTRTAAQKEDGKKTARLDGEQAVQSLGAGFDWLVHRRWPSDLPPEQNFGRPTDDSDTDQRDRYLSTLSAYTEAMKELLVTPGGGSVAVEGCILSPDDPACHGRQFAKQAWNVMTVRQRALVSQPALRGLLVGYLDELVRSEYASFNETFEPPD